MRIIRGKIGSIDQEVESFHQFKQLKKYVISTYHLTCQWWQI